MDKAVSKLKKVAEYVNEQEGSKLHYFKTEWIIKTLNKVIDIIEDYDEYNIGYISD